MTKAELIKALERYPDNMDVFVGPRITEFTYRLVNSVGCKEITFMEDEGQLYDTEEKVEWEKVEELPKIECIVLCED